MNERRGGSFSAKRKSGLHIAGERMNPYYSNHRPHNPHFNRERNTGYSMGSHHIQKRPRGRGFTGPPSYRSTSFKGKFNRYEPQPKEDAPMEPKETLSRPNASSSSSSSKTGPGNKQPATFICEGIEVNFDSSDSEEEVRPWKIVKVLKKNDCKTENASHTSTVKDEVSRSPKVIAHVQGNVVREHDMSGKDQSSDDEVQVLGPHPSDPIIVPETSKRPSFVVLSGLRKRTVSNTFKQINNCAIIKRPRFLFSQVSRPPIGLLQQPRFPLPCFQEKSPPQLSDGSGDRNVDITLQESRIIDDVLDMTEEVEMRARYLNYRYS